MFWVSTVKRRLLSHRSRYVSLLNFRVYADYGKDDDYGTSEEEGSADYKLRPRVADEEDSDEAAEFEGPELLPDEIEMRNDDGTYTKVKISTEEAAALTSKQYEDSLQERNDWKLSEKKVARRFAEIARQAVS